MAQQKGVTVPFRHAFDRIVVVSLKERNDRRAEMARELQGIPFAFFDAFRMSDPGPFLKVGSHGAFLSHLEILKEAARAGESVLILQDDCEFVDGAWDYPVPPCDIFYGSHGEDDPLIIGAHCMGFSAHAAGLAADYLEKLLDPATPPDPVAAKHPRFRPEIRPPIDGALVWFRRAHPELETRFAKLAGQRSSASDVSPGLIDQLPVIGPLARRLQKLIG